ncbi:MAG TPA: DUF222 domain-containing protein, partial [Terrimesophilobacter sp.]|nr:DUF222 domain-containing protein [Terrimesophilobacter sp.]
LIDDSRDRARFEDAVLERAASVTPARLRRLAQAAAEGLTAEPLQQRYEHAHEQRRVWTTELGDGMAQLTAVLPSVLATAIWDRLTEQASAVRSSMPATTAALGARGACAGDPRSYDQLRADLLAELLLTGEPSAEPDAVHCAAHGIRAEVSIVIPMLTLLGAGETGAGEQPATLTGGSPIDLGTALRLAGDATHWVRVLTDPVSDQVLAVDTYRHSASLRRLVRARDGRCRHPSCNRSPSRCDLDHTIEYQHGGKTTADNLACLCRNHHVLKSVGAWTVKQLSLGVLEWTSPRGRVTTDRPDTPVRFR